MRNIVKRERPMFKLTSATWNHNGDLEEATLEIFASDLKAAEVGMEFTPDLHGTAFGNDEIESLRVVSSNGAVVSCIFKQERYHGVLEWDDEYGELVVVKRDCKVEVKRVTFELH